MPAIAVTSGIGCMAHRNVFNSRALGRPLLETGMVQPFPSRHATSVRLRELLQGGAARRRISLGGTDYGDQ